MTDIATAPVWWREATAADTAPLCRLLNDAYRPAKDSEGWVHQADYVRGACISESQLSQQLSVSTAILALRGTELLGAVVVGFDGVRACIPWLAVRPVSQALGIGSFLLKRAEVFARAGSAECCELSILQPQGTLLLFLQNRGYQRCGKPEAVCAASLCGDYEATLCWQPLRKMLV